MCFVLCSLALWFAVINLYIIWVRNVTKVWMHMRVLYCCRVWVYMSTGVHLTHTLLSAYCVWPVGQLPQWAADWHIRWWLDFKPGVWRVTAHTIPANHLIYSCYNSSAWGHVIQHFLYCSVFNRSMLLCTFFNGWLIFHIWKALNAAAFYLSSIWINLRWGGGKWQMIDSATFSPARSGSCMSPQPHIDLSW